MRLLVSCDRMAKPSDDSLATKSARGAAPASPASSKRLRTSAMRSQPLEKGAQQEQRSSGREARTGRRRGAGESKANDLLHCLG